MYLPNYRMNRMPDPKRRWVILELERPPSGEEPLLVDALRRQGARAIEVVDGTVLAHLPAPEGDAGKLAEAIGFLLRSSLPSPPRILGVRERTEQDRRRLHRSVPPSRQVGTGITVHAGTRRTTPPDPREGGLGVAVSIGHGYAFGTAEHPTTRLCLQLLAKMPPEGMKVLDLGTGTGILAIAAARLGAREVLALDADPVAAEEALANVRTNGVNASVRVRNHLATPDSLRGMGSFDLAVANLEAPILRPLLDGLRLVVRPGGTLLLSGISEREAVGLELGEDVGSWTRIAAREEAGWWAGLLERRPFIADGSIRAS